MTSARTPKARALVAALAAGDGAAINRVRRVVQRAKSPKEAADALDVSVPTIHRWVRQHGLEPGWPGRGQHSKQPTGPYTEKLRARRKGSPVRR